MCSGLPATVDGDCPGCVFERERCSGQLLALGTLWKERMGGDSSDEEDGVSPTLRSRGHTEPSKEETVFGYVGKLRILPHRAAYLWDGVQGSVGPSSFPDEGTNAASEGRATEKR